MLLDLEDAVPHPLKARARHLVAEVAASQACWVRVNRARTDECERDLSALANVAARLRLPKVESAADVEWVAERVPGMPLDCTIESARGLLAAPEIAGAQACVSLSFGDLDLALDLGISGGDDEMLFARSFLVVAARAAGKPPPSDGVHPRIGDDNALWERAKRARRLGFFGKSAIHPSQVSIINEVFMPTAEELAWADQVLSAFEASGGAATKLPDGEFVDKAVADRASQILLLRR